MRLQWSSGSCGPTSLYNASKAKYNISYSKFRKLGDFPHGTDEHDIITIANNFNIKTIEFSTQNKQEAWAWLIGTLSLGSPVILCVDKWNHWVCAYGTLGNSIIIYDSSRTIRNQREHGVQILDKNRAMKRWVFKGKSLYGIAVV